ncbi:MAG: hypothetical protein M3357_14405, partial [Actinomycetota bacterium]|nr:hypothetical protein [Actinomycetota bacterium]
PPSAVERLLKGTYLSRPRSTDGAGISLGNQDEGPLREWRQLVGGPEGLVAAAARPAQAVTAAQPEDDHS